MSVLRFGVLGATSMVFRQAVRDAIVATEGVTLTHVATRGGRAEVGPDVRVSTDYHAVLDDDDVDVVYLPLPNHLHERWVVAAAAAGKHVLCEKPLATDPAAARRMVAACEDADVVLTEAYMSPFHPRSAAVRDEVERGALGEVLHGAARMSGVLPRDNHRWTVSAGGGALWDVGIYCLEPILDAFGWAGEEPSDVVASSILGGDGVDETTSAWLAFPDGRTLSLWVSFSAPDHQHLTLVGRERELVVPSRHATPMHGDGGYLLRERDGTVAEVETEDGSCYEGLVAHVRDVVAGSVEPLRPPSRSVATCRLVHRIATAAGLHIG